MSDIRRVMMTVNVQRAGGKWDRDRTMTLAVAESDGLRDRCIEEFKRLLTRALMDRPEPIDDEPEDQP